MSTFCGVFGRYQSNEINKLVKLFGDNSKIIQTENIYILIQQPEKNIYYFNQNNNGYCISGIGLEYAANGFKLIDNDGWRKYAFSIEDISLPDGHYCGVVWRDNKVTLFNDVLGIKHIYTFNQNESIYFSDKPLDLIKLGASNELNLDEFFASWFLNAKTTTKSLYKNINRLNGIVVYKNNNATRITEQFKLPNYSAKIDYNNFDEVLNKIINTYANNDKKLSLGLTGGLDSRLLLSYLLISNNKNWSTHTFGDEKLPDVIYSKQIAKELNFTHNVYDFELLNKNNLIDDLTKYASYTNISIPVSEMIQFGMHKRFADDNVLVMDGSYGETYRRQMLNRLLIKGKLDLIDKNTENIAKYIKSSRPNIFNDAYKNKINDAINNSVSEIFNVMPPLAELTLENWLDLFAIKVKLPNTTAYSQQVLDNICTSLTVFIQPTLLKIGLALPLSERINGKMFRKIINKNSFELTKFPLVKNHASYPYLFGNKASWLWTKAKSKINKQYEWNLNHSLLNQTEIYVKDKIASQDFKTSNLYNTELITKAVLGYYNGKKEYAPIVEWFLTMEVGNQKKF